MPGAQVEAVQAVDAAGKTNLETKCVATTDEGGEYACSGLPEGAYYLLARDANASSGASHGRRSGTARFSFYYLTTDLVSAEPVALMKGRGKAVDIGLGESPGYSVRGRLRGQGQAGSVAIMLFARKSRSEEINTGLTATYAASDGTFTFEGVPPGHYAVHAVWHDEEAPHSVEREVAVSDLDVNGIELSGDGVRLELTVIPCRTGDGSGSGLELTRADGELINGSSALNGTPVGDEGNRFGFPSVPAVRYFVHPLSKASAFVSGTSLSDDGAGDSVDVPAGSWSVTGSVQLECRASGIRGTVVGNEGRPATVVAVSAATGERFVRSAGGKGEFAVENLAPGEYQVYAIPGQADPHGFDLASTQEVSVDAVAGETATVRIAAPRIP